MIDFTELQHNGKTVKLYGDFEQSAIAQIRNMADTDLAKVANIAIMPDAHAGAGICIGFTASWIQNKNEDLPPISPDWIGVDIGCGVLTVTGKLQGEPNFSKIDSQIRRDVKLGFDINKRPVLMPPNFHLFETRDTYTNILNACIAIQDKVGSRSVANSLCTLGGGNHFIEIGISDHDPELYALTIHTGSRNFGLSVANYHSKKAKSLYKDRILRTNDEIMEYMSDMLLAQKYAYLNRRMIAAMISYHLFKGINYIIESAHNNIEITNIDKTSSRWTIRKGAISAKVCEYVSIPANMRDGTLIGSVLWPDQQTGLNANYSLPHGSGRTMSRSQAKAEIDTNHFKEQMNGIWSSSVGENTKDEAPDAYKDTDLIRTKVLPVLKDVKIFKPVYNLKG